MTTTYFEKKHCLNYEDVLHKRGKIRQINLNAYHFLANLLRGCVSSFLFLPNVNKTILTFDHHNNKIQNSEKI